MTARSAIARDLLENVDFCAGLLGLRLVKLRVSFDAPGAYHLYYDAVLPPVRLPAALSQR